jgi:hypothetical protein
MSVRYFQSSKGESKKYCTRDARTYEKPSGALGWFAITPSDITTYSIHIPAKLSHGESESLGCIWDLKDAGAASAIQRRR